MRLRELLEELIDEARAVSYGAEIKIKEREDFDKDRKQLSEDKDILLIQKELFNTQNHDLGVEQTRVEELIKELEKERMILSKIDEKMSELKKKESELVLKEKMLSDMKSVFDEINKKQQDLIIRESEIEKKELQLKKVASANNALREDLFLRDVANKNEATRLQQIAQKMNLN